MDGKFEVGTKITRGWTYQSGVNATLEFQPKVQKEILMQ